MIGNQLNDLQYTVLTSKSLFESTVRVLYCTRTNTCINVSIASALQKKNLKFQSMALWEHQMLSIIQYCIIQVQRMDKGKILVSRAISWSALVKL